VLRTLHFPLDKNYLRQDILWSGVFVGSFVRCARCFFSKSKIPIVPDFTINISEVKTAVFLVAMVRYLHEIWQSDISNFGVKYTTFDKSRDAACRAVSAEEISGNFLRKIISGYLFQSFRKFPEIYTENFPVVQTFQITVYLLTSSLSIVFYSTSGL